MYSSSKLKGPGRKVRVSQKKNKKKNQTILKQYDIYYNNYIIYSIIIYLFFFFFVVDRCDFRLCIVRFYSMPKKIRSPVCLCTRGNCLVENRVRK